MVYAVYVAIQFGRDCQNRQGFLHFVPDNQKELDILNFHYGWNEFTCIYQSLEVAI